MYQNYVCFGVCALIVIIIIWQFSTQRQKHSDLKSSFSPASHFKNCASLRGVRIGPGQYPVPDSNKCIAPFLMQECYSDAAVAPNLYDAEQLCNCAAACHTGTGLPI